MGGSSKNKVKKQLDRFQPQQYDNRRTMAIFCDVEMLT